MLLKLSSVAGGYGRAQVLHDVSLEVGEGEVVALLGVNGSGKSSTLRTISGLLPVWSGEILFDGAPMRRTPEARARAGLAHVPEGRGIFGSLSVRQNLRLGAVARRDEGKDMQADEDLLLHALPVLRRKLSQPASSLSGGEQQMLAVARALLARPRLVMIDEMSFGLAPMLVSELLQLVARLREQLGTAFLLVEQDSAVLDIADRAYVLAGGAVHASGTAQSFKESDRLVRAYLGSAKT